MTTLEDCRRIPVSTQNAGQLARLEHATELCASYFVDPLAVIDATLTEDPDFAMGHCLRPRWQ